MVVVAVQQAKQHRQYQFRLHGNRCNFKVAKVADRSQEVLIICSLYIYIYSQPIKGELKI